MIVEPFPPPNYLPVPSAVSGIEVYAPAPENVTPQQEVVDFTCPQCGGTTAFSAASGGLTCAHCGYFQPPTTRAVGQVAEEREFTVETLQQAERGWGEARLDLECQNCGARTSLPQEILTHTCPFCGSNRVIQRQSAQEELRPRFLIPFKIEAGACQGIARQWLGSSWMTPSTLKDIANQALFKGVYLPFWTFDSRLSAAWRAEVGHTVTESYYERGEHKTRTKTVWRWESGQVQLTVDDLTVPGTGHASTALLNQVQPFDMDGLCPYEPAYMAGFGAQSFDIPLDKAWETGRQLMREQARKACEGQASSSQIRNFSMELDFAAETWRYLLLPVYLATYTYDRRTFQAMINGQTGAVAGQRPVDWTRVWLAIAALLAPGLLLGLFGLLTLLLGGVGVVIGAVGFVLLVIGLVISVILWKQAQGMDDI